MAKSSGVVIGLVLMKSLVHAGWGWIPTPWTSRGDAHDLSQVPQLPAMEQKRDERPHLPYTERQNVEKENPQESNQITLYRPSENIVIQDTLTSVALSDPQSENSSKVSGLSESVKFEHRRNTSVVWDPHPLKISEQIAKITVSYLRDGDVSCEKDRRNPP